MSNLIKDVIPKILTSATSQLAEELPILNYVNRQYETEMSKQGDLVWVPIEGEGQVFDVVPGHTANNEGNTRTDAIPVPLSYWRESPFTMTDNELKQIMDGIMPEKVTSRVRALRNNIAQTIWDCYKYSFHTLGTPGTTPFQSDANFKTIAKGAKRTLNKELANSISRNRVMLLDTDAEAEVSMLDQFLHADKAGTDMTLRTGMIGQAIGFNWMFDNSEPNHTVGNLSDKTGVTIAQAVQTLSITNDLYPQMNPQTRYVVRMDCNTGVTGGLKKGDIFTVAGDSQTYVVEADCTVVASDKLDVQFYPAPKQTWAVNAAVTIYGSHAVNLAMHDKAIAFVMAPFTRPSDSLFPAEVSETYIDPLTGIPLRLEIYREYKQTRWVIDALWGAAPIYRQHMIRIVG